MIRSCFKALLSHWQRNPLQLLAFIGGLALATALWSGVQAINSEARASYDAAASTLGEGQFDQLLPRAGNSIALADFIKLRRAGWRVSPVVDGALGSVRVIGIDPLTSPSLPPLSGETADAGGIALVQENRLVANAETAAALPGDIAITVDPNFAPGVAIGDIGFVQDVLGRSDLSRLVIAPEQPLSRPALESIAPNLRLQPSTQVADVGELTDSFHLNLTAFGLLSFAVGLFIVHSTIGLAFEQRRAMIRTLRSLGVPLRLLITVIAGEMILLAVLGAGIGIALGYLIAGLLLPDVAATLRGLYGAEISGALALRPEWWISGFLLALLGTAIALVGRIWQIAQMPLLASVRPRAWVMASAGRFRLQSIASLFLLFCTVLLAGLGSGLYAAFALLGCLLIGAALALPVLAERLLAFVQARSKAPAWRWFWADTRQQLPGLGLALMALLLAVSANIGVSTMVSSFRLTFTDFLDQRLAPELFLRVETREDSARLLQFLDRKGLETLPLLRMSEQIAGQSVELYGVTVGPTYRDSWAFLDQIDAPWDAVELGAGVVVNEQFARRGDLWVGAEVEITPDLTLPIAAVVGDYGNPQGQIVLSQSLFADLHPQEFARQFGVRTDDAAALRGEITRELALPDSVMIDQGAIKAMSLEVFERTFTVTAALNVLTLAVAGFAILMSLLTLADLRVPQLAPVWALGFTRAGLGQIELGRTVFLALLVFLCAIPLGLALAWVLLTIVNVEAFGWQLPMFLFPGDYLRLGFYGLIAAALAALWPAWRLMRTPPSALLKVFANER